MSEMIKNHIHMMVSYGSGAISVFQRGGWVWFKQLLDPQPTRSVALNLTTVWIVINGITTPQHQWNSMCDGTATKSLANRMSATAQRRERKVLGGVWM